MADSNKHWLFSYGTLQDPEVQLLLFGCLCPCRSARLKGWSLYASDEDGYLFIKPNPSGVVSGRIIEIDDSALHMADRWEDAPYYLREKTAVAIEDGSEREAWVYTRRDAQGKLYAGGDLSALDRPAVMEALRRFLEEEQNR